MQAERPGAGAEELEQLFVPRALPNSRFVQNLDQDIRRTARQHMERVGICPSVPFEEMVIELRKLVRLLRKTLVPLKAPPEFAQPLRRRLEAEAIEVTMQQHQRRWLVVGGVVGSLISVVGLSAALLMRRHNGNGHNGHNHNGVQAKEPAEVA
jgi:hypothetical protein